MILGLAGRDLDRPGIYYDEVIQADPAVRFLTADPKPQPLPGVTQVRIFGRWFPVMTQPYMGALKSQLLIPFFALFGADGASLRMVTLGWSLVGLLLLMLWSRAELGLSVALIAGALVALDPSFLFVSRHDWGSISLAFVCRCGGLYAIHLGWRSPSAVRSPIQFGVGGLLLGLGVYNKIDFAVFVVAAGLALLAVSPRSIAAVARAPRLAAGLAIGAALGLAPLISSISTTFELTLRALDRTPAASDWTEKWQTQLAMFDGSYFDRMISAGGTFENMFATDGASSAFAFLFAASAIYLLVRQTIIFRRGETTQEDTTRRFVLLLAVLIPVGVLLMPRTVRIHHALLAVPFPQLVVAIAATDLWRVDLFGVELTGRAVGRALAAALVSVALFGSLRVDLATFETIRETGGKGRWSDSLVGFAPELAGHRVVSLDWGLHLPLRFAAPELSLHEPIWKIRALRKRRNPWTFDGSADHVYLAVEGDNAVFGYGEQLLATAQSLPEDLVAIRRHTDRVGDPTFVSLQIAAPHRLVYKGEFEIQLVVPIPAPE